MSRYSNFRTKSLYEFPIFPRMQHALSTSYSVIQWPLSHFLWIKPTDALNSSLTGITTLHVWGSFSAHHQEFLAVHWHWYILCSMWWRFATRNRVELSSILLLVAKGHHILHKMYQCRCTAKNSQWWAERLPETCRVVIPIKLKFSASVGFIHKEFVTMHGRTILKFLIHFCSDLPLNRIMEYKSISITWDQRCSRF